MKFNYKDRITLKEALRHPYLKEFHQDDDEV
jgi:hypothetical protein